MKNLSRDEMKNLKGGDETIDDGGQCLEEFDYDCSYQAGCCSPLRCEQNATSSGTICMAPR